MLRRRTKKKSEFPTGIRTHDLPNTGRALYSLELRRTQGERGHILGSPYSTTSTLLILAVCRTPVKYEPETHKALKHITRVQCSWILTFTVFGNLVKDIHFQQNCCCAITMRWWPDFFLCKVKTRNGKRKFKRMLSFLFVEEGKLFIKKSSFEDVCMYIVSWTFYTFFSSALKKNYKMRSDLNFAICSNDFTCLNGSTIQIVLRELPL